MDTSFLEVRIMFCECQKQNDSIAMHLCINITRRCISGEPEGVV